MNDEFYLYGTSLVHFQYFQSGEMVAHVLRAGATEWQIDNHLISAIQYDRHDYAKELTREEFAASLVERGIPTTEEAE